jgi:hypothetical protein
MIVFGLTFSDGVYAGAMEEDVIIEDESYRVVGEKDKLLGIIDLDLRIKDMGYRWVHDLNDNDNGHAMRTFMTFGLTKKDTLRFGWNREGISDPLQNGNDNVMFEFKHNFD